MKDWLIEQPNNTKLNKLKKSNIELCNISRDSKSFALVADVKVDGRYLAPELIKQGLAQLETNTQKPEELPVQTTPKIEEPQKSETVQPTDQAPFVCSKNSNLFHKKDCPSAKKIAQKNFVSFQTREEAIDAGKAPCSKCKP